MSALKKKENKRLTNDINIIYDFTDKPNRTNLKAKKDRAVVAKLRADLVLPEDKILTVDIDFDTTSGYHSNTLMVMDDYGVDLLATAFEFKYGKVQADALRKAWEEKQKINDPRKPTYLLVQKPNKENELPKVFAACGERKHDDDIAPDSII